MADPAHAEVLGFAYSLMEEGDYYRAIGEFKRFAFLEPRSPDLFAAQLAIGRAYELGGKASDAVAWLQRLEPQAETPQLKADLVVEIAFARYLAGASQVAADDLSRLLGNQALAGAASDDTRQRARYLLGWSHLASGEANQAAEAFQGVALPYAGRMAHDALRFNDLPHKSPVLAGLLSVLVPGLGHLYLGEPGIAGAAFAWNALFGFATYDAARHKLWGVTAVLGGLELMWYGGAVVGAVSGAYKYNRDAELNQFDAMRQRYDPAPPSWPPAGQGQ